MRRSWLATWYPAGLVAAALAVSAWAYPRLPARVPTHFDVSGVANGWSGRADAALEVPALMLVLWAAFRFIPTVDPRRANYATFERSYDLITGATLVFLCALHALLLLSAAGIPLPLQSLLSVACGLFLIAVGNVLPRVRPNWVVGVRAPWTFAGGPSWARSQRAGGYALVGGGLLFLLSAAVPTAATFRLAVGGTIVGVLGTLVYSYAASDSR